MPTFPDLEGKVAVVTGATKGIGRATCELLAHNGCRIGVVARSPGEVDAAAEVLRSAGAQTTVPIAVDAADANGVATARRRAEEALGPVDIVLPFAGGFDVFSSVWETSEQEWDQVLRVNLTSTFLALREFLPGMIHRGRGSIVVMSSISARSLDKLTTASYAAAKSGVLMLMRHAAIEAGEHGIRINAIAPATVTSERIDRMMDDAALARTAALSPLGRLGTPDDCAGAAVFLASDAASWITGITLDVAGGRVML